MWTKSQLQSLSKIWGPVYHYANDSTDEFQVIREDGRVQGIFKIWAIPVIPFLDFGAIELLGNNWETILAASKQRGFLGSLEYLEQQGHYFAREALKVLLDWDTMVALKPKFLGQSLARALLNTYQIDRRLAQFYQSEPTPKSLVERVAQLVNRVVLSLGLLSPFYDLEAAIASREFLGRFDLKEQGGGVLDAIAVLLPACFEAYARSEEELFLVSSEISYGIIRRGGNQARVLIGLSKLTGLKPSQVWYAAQKLHQVPGKFSGRPDLTEETALRKVVSLIHQFNGNQGILSAAANTNAYIRFNNWVPFELVNGEITHTCESLSATSANLVELLTQVPEIWAKDFAEVFVSSLAGQVKELDAESAKGRFMLQLIYGERKLLPEFYPAVNVNQDWVEKVISWIADEGKRRYVFHPVSGYWPRDLGGDKTLGLTTARYISGLHGNFLPSWVISVDALENMFNDNEKLSCLITQQVRAHSLELKLLLAQHIRAAVKDLELPEEINNCVRRILKEHPNQLWVARSSCIGEDDPGTMSPGIYHTALRLREEDVAAGIKASLASWFSQEAVSFRWAHGQGDIPVISILIQPWCEGIGGMIAVGRDKKGVCVSVQSGKNPQAVTSGLPGCETKNFRPYSDKKSKHSEIENQLIRVALELYKYFGEVEIEWVWDGFGVKVLQVKPKRSMNRVKKAYRKEEIRLVVRQGKVAEITEALSEGRKAVALELDGTFNLEAFQGDLIAMICTYGEKIIEIRHSQPVPASCHFANICLGLGIRLVKI